MGPELAEEREEVAEGLSGSCPGHAEVVARDGNLLALIGNDAFGRTEDGREGEALDRSWGRKAALEEGLEEERRQSEGLEGAAAGELLALLVVLALANERRALGEVPRVLQPRERRKQRILLVVLVVLSCVLLRFRCISRRLACRFASSCGRRWLCARRLRRSESGRAEQRGRNVDSAFRVAAAAAAAAVAVQEHVHGCSSLVAPRKACRA